MISDTREWTVTVGLDLNTGDLILPIPPDLMQQKLWKDGDILEWFINPDGTCTIETVKN